MAAVDPSSPKLHCRHWSRIKLNFPKLMLLRNSIRIKVMTLETSPAEYYSQKWLKCLEGKV